MDNTSGHRRRWLGYVAAIALVAGVAVAAAMLPAGAQGVVTSCGIAPAGMNVIESNNGYIRGTDRDDFICGGASRNVVRGLAGDDIIYGLGGDDNIIGGTGNDIVYGGDGDDQIVAYGGDDELWGGDGDDSIYGGYLGDMIYGGDGNDLLSGGFGTDTLDGGDGDDRVIGGKGADVLRGGIGEDRLFGGWGTDSVDGGEGDDILFGGYADDTLIGGPGADTVYSAAGDDVQASATQDTVHVAAPPATSNPDPDEDDDDPGAGDDTGSLPTSNYMGSYTLDDDEFGTRVWVTVSGTTRTITTNALPDHDTGTFPTSGNPNTISAQNLSYTFPLVPTYTGAQTEVRIPGVAVNGVKYSPATVEVVACSSGQTYPVEAMQDVYNLGLDFNNAHVQSTGEYHYHGVSTLLTEAYSSGQDLVHVGFAADGFMMYYSKSGAYRSGYKLSTDSRTGTGCVESPAIGGRPVTVAGTSPDGTYVSDWEWSRSNGDLDECNGIEIDDTYVYIVTDEFPFIGRCLNGQPLNSGNRPGFR